MDKFPITSDWIKAAAKYIISRLWDVEKYKIVNDTNISAIFLAWAPWAWKTEFLETVFNDLKDIFVVIDIDIYRKLFKWYNGDNSSKYQNASVRVADKVLKFCFKNKLNFIFDGTFRNYNKAQQNFEQCEKYKRNVLVTLVFQDPRISFYYTFLRKLKKKRNVPIDVFIDGFYGSIESVFKVKKNFKEINIMIACKKYALRDRKQFSYDVNYEIWGVSQFCKKYGVWYYKWNFINRNRLQLDIEDFNNTPVRHFSWTWWIWTKIKIWYIEKFYKL